MLKSVNFDNQFWTTDDIAECDATVQLQSILKLKKCHIKINFGSLFQLNFLLPYIAYTHQHAIAISRSNRSIVKVKYQYFYSIDACACIWNENLKSSYIYHLTKMSCDKGLHV